MSVVATINKESKHSIRPIDDSTQLLNTKQSKSQTQPAIKERSAESTMMIGDFSPRQNSGVVDKSVSIDGIEFVDLGLSVRWANCNIGSNIGNPAGKFFTKRMDGNLNDLYQWNTQGAIVPSINNFEELLTKCRWMWEELDGTRGYKIVGPNGNNIFLPVTGDGIKYPGKHIETFGLLWTNEALLNEWCTDSHLLYFNTSTYQLASYITNKTCPIRLVLR